MAGLSNYFQTIYPLDPSWVVFKDDFQNTLSTLSWATVKDAGASAAIGANAQNGTLVLTSTATTDDDGALVQGVGNFWLPTAAKAMYMETRCQIADATQMDFYFGWAAAAATNPENILASASRMGFEKLDGTAVLSAVTTASSVSTTSSCQQSFTAATYVKLGILFDGTTAYFLINDSQVQSISSTIPAAVMTPAMFELSGIDTGTKSATFDYVVYAYQR